MRVATPNRFRLVALAAAALLSWAAPAAGQNSRAEIEAIVKDYLEKNPEQVQRIVRDYLAKNPDVVREALTELLRRQMAAKTPVDRAAAVRSNAALLFDSPRHVVIGNPKGDVTLVEFFDYNCGYCKNARGDKLALIEGDPNLRVVLKELPLLGPGSVDAARVAIAVRLQDRSGEKYLAFHQRMLMLRGQATKESAIAVAREIGIDIGKLDKDMAGEEVRLALEENAQLARAISINGTPSYVVGEQVVIGAAGIQVLKSRIAAARK